MDWWREQNSGARLLLVALICLLLACICGLAAVLGLVLLKPERATPAPSATARPEVTRQTVRPEVTRQKESTDAAGWNDETGTPAGQVSPEWVVQCTPPACALGEAPMCPEGKECPGGCGVVCLPVLPTIGLQFTQPALSGEETGTAAPRTD